MKSSDLDDSHIGGQFTTTLTGPITGLTRGPNYVEVNVDPGLPGGTVVTLRILDDDPMDVEATEGPERLNHDPDLTLSGLTPEQAEAMKPTVPAVDVPADDRESDPADDDPTPEAGE